MSSSTLKTVLLVDDDVDHLTICSLILRRHHFAVHMLTGCTSEQDLLHSVEGCHPSLIFMDHDMPGLGGIDATRLLKSNPSSHSIPIIYFSGHDDIAQLAAAAGADDFLRKHLYVPKLLELT